MYFYFSKWPEYGYYNQALVLYQKHSTCYEIHDMKVTYVWKCLCIESLYIYSLFDRHDHAGFSLINGPMKYYKNEPKECFAAFTCILIQIILEL